MVEQDKRLKDLQSSLALLRQLRIALPLSAALLTGLWWAPPDLQVNFSGCAWVGIFLTVLMLARIRQRVTGPAAMSPVGAGVLIWVASVLPPVWYLFFQVALPVFCPPFMAAFQKIDSTAYAPLIYISAYVALSAVLMQINRVLRAKNRRLIFRVIQLCLLAGLLMAFLPFAWHGLISILFYCFAGHAYTTVHAEHDALLAIVGRAPWFLPLAMNMYVTMRALLGIGTKKRFEADPLIVVMASLAQLFVAVGLTTWPSTICHPLMRHPGHYLIGIGAMALVALVIFVQHFIHLLIKSAFEDAPAKQLVRERAAPAVTGDQEEEIALIEVAEPTSKMSIDEPEREPVVQFGQSGNTEAMKKDTP